MEAVRRKLGPLTLDIPVAIKILSPAQKKVGSQLAERFLKEAQVIARINHANIVVAANRNQAATRPGPNGQHGIVVAAACIQLERA